MKFFLTSSSIESTLWCGKLTDYNAGALVFFEGRVRKDNNGKEVVGINYQTHTSLALNQGERILGEVIDHLMIIDALAVHRTGSLKLGETAVWVGVLSVHRKEAFNACDRIIDKIKKEVPIWKQEQYVDGVKEWLV